MDLWSVYKELELLAHVHGWETPIRTGGIEGDEIGSVWHDDEVGCIYVG